MVGLMQDIKRVFTYHGAEHKAVNAYEAGAADGTGSYQAVSAKAHVRCGTSFLFFVMFIAIIVFSLAGRQTSVDHGAITHRTAAGYYGAGL